MGGWWTVGRLRGAPIRIHWSTPIGAFLFGGFGWNPGFWVAFVIVVLFHELGHAAMVRATGHTVADVDVHGAGGECSWDGDPTRLQRAVIAWGGVWAQLAVALAAFIVTLTLTIESSFVAQMLVGLVRWNLFMAAFNLLPIPPLDGAEAWKLPGLLMERRRRAKAMKAATSSRPLAKVLPLVRPAKPRVVDKANVPYEEDGPLSEEARRVVQRAQEIAKQASLTEKDKKK